MGKHNGKRSRNGKGPPKKRQKVIKNPTRETWTCEQRDFVCKIRKEGKQPHEILKIFKERYGVVPKPSTLSTWYNKKNMELYEQRGPRSTSMARVETHVNPLQRPTILIDMEFALVSMLKKASNTGTVTTKKSVQKMGRGIFNKLRALNIYEDSGERPISLADLNEERIATLLANATNDMFPCPLLCGADVRRGGNYLLVHIEEFHPPNDVPIESTHRAKEFKFVASDGWARNFLDRHVMHSVTVCGEIGSNDQETAEIYVDKFRDDLIRLGKTPREVVHILLNIDETGIVYKSVPKRTYKFINTTFMAKKESKDRVTVLVGAAMDGFKLKPVVIGKAQRPMALRGENMDELPVHYYGQESAWMSKDIMNHWFIMYLDDELKAHYGAHTDVILTIDNATCHPPDLNGILDYVEVRFLPPNTTALIQPMDQGVIHVFKKNFLDLYYNKMIDYFLQTEFDGDPMDDFAKSYTMKDVVFDIGAAWETVEAPHIHKCFEKLIRPDDYVKKYNERYNTNVEWSGVNFRGFQDPDDDNSAAEKADKIKDLVSKLHDKISYLPVERRVIIDCDSVRDAINYDPNDDLGDPSEFLQDGFSTQRGAEGLESGFESEENEPLPSISHKKREALKALANINLIFRREDFKSQEEADQASKYLKGLQEIFQGMKDPTASTIDTPPRPSSTAPAPEPSTSGVSTTFRPARVSTIIRPPLSPVREDDTLEELDFIDVPMGPASATAASPTAASPTAASPTAASPSAADTDDKSDTSDVDQHVFPGFGEADVKASAASASAAAAASSTAYLHVSRSPSYEDDDDGNTMQVSRFTALNPTATSSPRTGRTIPGSSSSTSVASPSPSPPRPICRPRREVARRSASQYADLDDDSSEDITVSEDEAYIPEA